MALCHLCLVIGAANQVSQISGPGLVVMCRLGSGWDQSTVCIWQGRKAVHDVQWCYSLESSLRLFHIFCKKTYSWLLLVSAVTLPHVEFKTFKLFCCTKTQIFPNDFKNNCWFDHHHIPSMAHFQAAPTMGICRCLEAQWWWSGEVVEDRLWDVSHSPNLLYSKGIGSPEAAIPLLKVM